MDSPLDRFQQWWEQALSDSPLQQKSAVCVSTIDEKGFPSGRFVDLKSVSDSGFVFCTYLDSVKGQDILRNPNIAMTVWWDHVGSGKSGGIRAIYYWKKSDHEIWMLTLYSKSERARISGHTLKQIAEAIKNG